MKWHLCSIELNREFAITDDDGLVIAYPVTQKAQSQAKWNNKRLKPLTLWNQVANAQEQFRTRLMVAAPDLLDALEETLGCLENWMEIADEEDQRDYDRDAVKKAHAIIKKLKRE